MLRRFDPFRDFDQLTGHAFGTARASMPMDAYRQEKGLIIHFDLPGVDPASIDVTVERKVLTVAATREWSRDGVEAIVAERPQGTFRRQLYLGDGLDPNQVDASYDAGVLTVRVPVAAEAKARKVEVTTGAAAPSAEAAAV